MAYIKATADSFTIVQVTKGQTPKEATAEVMEALWEDFDFGGIPTDFSPDVVNDAVLHEMEIADLTPTKWLDDVLTVCIHWSIV